MSDVLDAGRTVFSGRTGLVLQFSVKLHAVNLQDYIASLQSIMTHTCRIVTVVLSFSA